MRHSARAFTLIELMAVIVIASLVTAMGAIGIGGVMRQTKFQRTVAGFMQMDVRARLHARTGGRVTQMVIDPNARTAKVVTWADIQQDQPLQLSILEWPADLAVRVEASSQDGHTDFGTTTIPIDRLGSSEDYAIMIHDDARVRRCEVSGLTGDIHVTEATP